MFTISAKRQDVIITGMDIVSRRNISSDVTIYTRRGSYHEGSPSPIVFVGTAAMQAEEWQEVYRGTIPPQPYKLVTLDDFDVEVSIGAGQTQSFFVFVSNGLLYTGENSTVGEASATEGGAVAEDDTIVIYNGQVMRGLFDRVVGRGRWGGIMRYRIA